MKTDHLEKKRDIKFDILASGIVTMYPSRGVRLLELTYENVYNIKIDANVTFKDFRVFFSIKALDLPDGMSLLMTPIEYEYYRGTTFSDISDYMNCDKHWNKITKHLKDELIIRLDEIEANNIAWKKNIWVRLTSWI